MDQARESAASARNKPAGALSLNKSTGQALHQTGDARLIREADFSWENGELLIGFAILQIEFCPGF